MSLREHVGAFVSAPKIQNLITILIVINAITLGLETDAGVRENFGAPLAIFDKIILSIFIAEIAAKQDRGVVEQSAAPFLLGFHLHQ